MPSPFPGMDPYLENPDWFPDLHGSLITFIKGALQQSLPTAYYAQSSERVWLEYSRRYVEPDVEVARRAPRQRQRQRNRGGTAVGVFHEAGPVVISVKTTEHGPFKESYLEIRRRRGKDIQIVTSIEILSPSNKKAGNPGREKYLQKQRETLGSETHLVEIDLLRGGKHTVAAPRALVEAKAGPFDYLVSIHRFNRPNDFFVYPIALAERLPEIAIPLMPGDSDVLLALQPVFDQAYDLGPYRREIEYGRDPVVPRLSAEQSAWAATLIKQRGRRA
jgi:hypothetical protein